MDRCTLCNKPLRKNGKEPSSGLCSNCGNIFWGARKSYTQLMRKISKYLNKIKDFYEGDDFLGNKPNGMSNKHFTTKIDNM
ncbi:MAG: hypothetical protein ACP5D2_02090 [Candidatus Nanoarchaeia archaeon]